MKKMFCIISCLLLISSGVYAASRTSSRDKVETESYFDTGAEASIELTLDTTPGTLTTVTLPDAAKGFRLYPRTNACRFAVYASGSTRTLAAVATDTDNTVAAADLAIGGIAKADVWETRLLPSYNNTADRILTIRSLTADAVVDLEVF